MSKFSEYIKTSVKVDTSENLTESYKEEITEQNIEEALNKYSTLSREELMQEFLKESSLLKQRGGLDDEHINKIEKVLKPHLNEEQQSMFDNLMTEIK